VNGGDALAVLEVEVLGLALKLGEELVEFLVVEVARHGAGPFRSREVGGAPDAYAAWGFGLYRLAEGAPLALQPRSADQAAG
jgi:hypothetical protein